MPPNYIIDIDVRAEGRNISNLFNKTQFYILSKENLSEANWTTNQTPYTMTGEVTRICFTNHTPQGFFYVTDGNDAVPIEE
jgi:hypothetical protein